MSSDQPLEASSPRLSHSSRPRAGLRLIRPQWPVPAGIHACTTSRQGGYSAPPYASLNLGDQVGDAAQAVRSNRERLRRDLGLPSEPRWLQQAHGNRVLDLDAPGDDLHADGACTSTPGRICVVLSADCLPLLLCNRAGTRVAALHCGWRGLVSGIIESSLERMGCASAEILAWLGPAIGPSRYEVGEETRDVFMDHDRGFGSAFIPSRPGHWRLDLYAIARHLLQAHGLRNTYGGQHCTYTEKAWFFSHRRDGVTGRMASLIWMAHEDPGSRKKKRAPGRPLNRSIRRLSQT